MTQNELTTNLGIEPLPPHIDWYCCSPKISYLAGVAVHRHRLHCPTLFLQALEDLHKRLRVLRSTNLHRVVDDEIRNARDVLFNSVPNLSVHLLAALITRQPLHGLLLVEPRFHASFEQNFLRGNVLLVLKVRGEELLDDARLHLRTLRLPELDQSMRVARISSSSAVFEVDAFCVTDLGETFLHHGGAFFPKLGLVSLLFVNAFGRSGVKVEWKPVGRKRVVGPRVLLLVCRDALFKALLTDIAPCCIPVR